MGPTQPTARTRRWTIAELLEWTRTKFGEVGIPDPRTDAEYLLAHALNCTRLQLFVDHARLLDEEERAGFRELVRRRLAREPVAYITKCRGFHALDLDLEVDARVLIPRPETEHLVDWLLASIRPPPAPVAHVVDVGTGSGAIALAIKRARSDLEVTAVDLSPEALELARSNAERNGLEVRFERSDLLGDIDPPAGGWNVVAANLPYIPTEVLATLEPEVRDFEPASALDGGPEGLDFIARLIAQCAAPGVMAPGGALFLEVGIGQAPAVLRQLTQAGFLDASAREDLGGIERVVCARRA
jgi:release factor glutamine methyltransferase